LIRIFTYLFITGFL